MDALLTGKSVKFIGSEVERLLACGFRQPAENSRTWLVTIVRVAFGGSVAGKLPATAGWQPALPKQFNRGSF